MLIEKNGSIEKKDVTTPKISVSLSFQLLNWRNVTFKQ